MPDQVAISADANPPKDEDGTPMCPCIGVGSPEAVPWMGSAIHANEFLGGRLDRMDHRIIGSMPIAAR
jgi:hypothetical protein